MKDEFEKINLQKKQFQEFMEEVAVRGQVNIGRNYEWKKTIDAENKNILINQDVAHSH